jgi:methylmalonyl-CoA/ethylmalonyl-CoA epimerase
LLESNNETGPIQKFIDKRGEGIHHIAFEVEDIMAEIERLQKQGFIMVNDKPKPGADNKLIVFCIQNLRMAFLSNSARQSASRGFEK